MKCYLCSSTSLDLRKGVVRDAPDIRIFECRCCGLVALEESFRHVKSGHYENSGMHGLDTPSMSSWLRDTDNDDERRFQMFKEIIVNRTVLDFGCGAAGFLKKAQNFATEVAGVELEQRVHDYWGGKIPLHKDIATVGNNYDLITAFHVIEHMTDPRDQLKKLSDRLSENGRIIIEVPNSDDALLTLFDNESFQRFTYWSQHLFLFNAFTLKMLIQQAGLKVISVKQYQRYPLSNHLHWLSQGKPGGHKSWQFLNNQQLDAAYANSLASLGKCDTLIAHVELLN